MASLSCVFGELTRRVIVDTVVFIEFNKNDRRVVLDILPRRTNQCANTVTMFEAIAEYREGRLLHQRVWLLVRVVHHSWRCDFRGVHVRLL